MGGGGGDGGSWGGGGIAGGGVGRASKPVDFSDILHWNPTKIVDFPANKLCFAHDQVFRGRNVFRDTCHDRGNGLAPDTCTLLDLGSGYGGTARAAAKEFGCKVGTRPSLQHPFTSQVDQTTWKFRGKAL